MGSWSIIFRLMKLRFTLIAILTSVVLWGQNGTVSPYSYFGLGDFRTKSTVENRMMGGLSMLGDSIHINLQNPAAYGSLRLTTYAVGAHNMNYTFKSATETATAIPASAVTAVPDASGIGQSERCGPTVRL